MTASDVLAEMVRLLRSDHDPRAELAALLPTAEAVLRRQPARRIDKPTGRPVIAHGPTCLTTGIPTRPRVAS